MKIGRGERNKKDGDETGQRKIPILRETLNTTILNRYIDEIEAIYKRSGEVAIGGGVFDGRSSRSCVAAMLMLSQQSMFRDGMGCIVVRNKREAVTVNDVKNRLFPNEKTMQMMVVEFGEIEQEFTECVPEFAKTLETRLKIVSGGGRVLGRIKRQMKDAMDKVSKDRKILFSSSLPYPQTIRPLLLFKEDDEFHIYKHSFAYLLVIGIPETELQVHAINSICADTRWVSPYSMPIDMEKDQIEEDRPLVNARLPYLIALSSNTTWARDLSVFPPWPESAEVPENDLMAPRRATMTRAARDRCVIHVPDRFWGYEDREDDEEENTASKSHRKRKRSGPIVEDLTENLNIRHYLFVVSMPKTYHDAENQYIEQMSKRIKTIGPKKLLTIHQYRHISKTLVSLMDAHMRAEQIQVILGQFPRYKWNRTAIVTSSKRVSRLFEYCQKIHPGLRIVSFDHSSLRKRSEVADTDPDGNPLPPVERVIITDPFALSERPDRRIFATFGNNITFTWVVTRYGLDKSFATRLMSIPYDYKNIYTRDSNVLAKNRPNNILQECIQDHVNQAHDIQPFSEGHYFDQETSYRTNNEAHLMDHTVEEMILPHQVEDTDQKCLDEGKPMYRIHLPHNTNPEKHKWHALPVCLLRELFEIAETCKNAITTRKNSKLRQSIVEYRENSHIEFKFSIPDDCKTRTPHSKRTFINCSDTSGYNNFRETVFIQGKYDKEVTESEFNLFCTTHLGIESFSLEYRDESSTDSIRRIPLDNSLLFFAMQHKHCILQSTAPSVEKQLALFSFLSDNAKHNTLYLLACASLHSLLTPVFNPNTGALCLITTDDSLLGYTEEQHAKDTLKSMVAGSLSSQLLTFTPDYSVPLIKRLFENTRREIDVHDYQKGWKTVTLSAIAYDAKEEREIVREFVRGEDNSEDEKAVIMPASKVISLQNRSRTRRKPTRRSKKRPKQSSKKPRTAISSTMVSWKKTKQKKRNNNAFSSITNKHSTTKPSDDDP